MSRLSRPIVIVGAGAAGLACAITAAKQGSKVILLEKSAQLGGTVTQSLIHTLGGLFYDQSEFLNRGLPVELTERLSHADPLTCKRRIGKNWVLNVDPKVYEKVVSEWINEYPTIELHYHSCIKDISVNTGCIEKISVISEANAFTIQPQLVIDCSGGAAVVRAIDSSLVTSSHVLAGLILQLRCVTPKALNFPKGVAILQQIRKAVKKQELPAECASLWMDTGVYPDEVYIKFNLLLESYDQIRMATVIEHLLSYLRLLPGFHQASINVCGQLGIRDAGRIKGEYTLTEADLKQGRQFNDAVCRASWPIEYWHPQQGVQLEHFPSGHSYEIPLRALKINGLDNLVVAGKCFSAEPLAQASARVVGTCWAMGEGLIKRIIWDSDYGC